MSDAPTPDGRAEAEKGLSRAAAVKMVAAGIAGGALAAPETASAANSLYYFAQNSGN
jgi:hypothetical protein